VVAFVRGRSRQKRVGHAGTLDPFATGVLPVCLGKATRVIEYLMDARKTYAATVRLGVKTDTYDRTGAVVAERDPSAITRADVQAALRTFEGEILQSPPPFSAIKRDGVPLYKLARAGEKVEVIPRRVVVHRIALTAWDPPLFEFEVECGKGTYVRSLAHDLGKRLGVGASLEELRRTKVGDFDLRNAVGIEELRAGFDSGRWTDLVMGADEVLLGWPAAIIGAENERRLRNGMAAAVEEIRTVTTLARAYGVDGGFFAVIRRDSPGQWRPEKVL
jgi:tRNA pseudouridine55 synthase